jgi:hypothetical protein
MVHPPSPPSAPKTLSAESEAGEDPRAEDPDAVTKGLESQSPLPAEFKDGQLQLAMALGCYMAAALFMLYLPYPLKELIDASMFEGLFLVGAVSTGSAYVVAALFAYRGSTPGRWFLSFLTVGSVEYVVAELIWWNVFFPHVFALVLCVIAEALLLASPEVRRFRAHQRQLYGKRTQPPSQAREPLRPEDSAQGRQKTLVAGGVLLACTLFMQLLNSGAFSDEPTKRGYGPVQFLFLLALLGVVGAAAQAKRWARSVLIGLGFVTFFLMGFAFDASASASSAYVLVVVVELVVALVLWRSKDIRRYFGVS